jgi:solute carrier family 20 (sodium-dependent phosphate transporter)
VEVLLSLLKRMLIFRGAPGLGLDNLSNGAIIGAVLGVAGVTSIVCIVFLLPYFHRRLVKEDWTIRFYHVFWGPALLFRGPVPPHPTDANVQVVQDFYRGKITKQDLQKSALEQDVIATKEAKEEGPAPVKETTSSLDSPTETNARPLAEVDRPEAFYKSPSAFWQFLKRTVLRGMFVEVVEEQSRSNGSRLDNLLSKNVAETHAHAHKYDNKTEYLYSMLQVFTATTASFAHGYPPPSHSME